MYPDRMSLPGTAKVFAAGAAWRLTGLDSAGRVLVDSVISGTEDEVTLAGILLVRAGDRSVPLVTSALETGANAPELLDVLVSVGSDAARTALQNVAQAPTSQASGAAEKALQQFDDIRRHQA